MTGSNTHLTENSPFVAQGRAARIGRFLFQSRNFISAPLFLLLLFLFVGEYEKDVVIWTVGPAVLGAGELLRLWSMRHIGRSARTRKDKAKRLVATGPYALIRNPLYVGNHVILVGFCILSELLWFIPIALLVCFVFYSFIVRYEEQLLQQRLGDEYLQYKNETPRWNPFPALVAKVDPNWREAFHRERSTVYGILAGIVLFGLKEMLDRLI